MNFVLTPILGKDPLNVPPLEINTTKEKAWIRAKKLAGGLADMLEQPKLVVRVDRTDKPMKGYLVNKNGHTPD